MAERVEKVWRTVHSVLAFYGKLPKPSVNPVYAVSLVWGIL